MGEKKIVLLSGEELIGPFQNEGFEVFWGVSDRPANIGYCGGFFICEYRRHLADRFHKQVMGRYTVDKVVKRLILDMENPG